MSKKRRIKVLFVITCMTAGGAEKVLIDLVNAMDKDRYAITILRVYKHNIYSDKDPEFAHDFCEKVKLRYLCNNRNKVVYRWFNRLINHMNKRFLYRLLIDRNYDTEIAFTEGMPTILVAHSSNKYSRKIAWFHTDAESRQAYLSREDLEKEKELYKRFDHIAVVSKTVEISFKKVFGSYPGLCVKYNPVNRAEIQKAAWQCQLQLTEAGDENKLILVSVGRLVQVKGYERLISVMQRLKKEGWAFKWFLVGEGNLRSQLETKVKSCQLTDCIQFTGFQENPYQYMAQSDLLICSSYAEGYSTAVLEAVTLGLPVVTTSCSGMQEIFGERECGIICENSFDGLYSALEKIMCQPELITYYKAQCILRARELEKVSAVSEIQKIIG